MATVLSPTLLLYSNPRNLFSSSTPHCLSLLYHSKTPSFRTPMELHHHHHHHQYPLEPFTRTRRGEVLVARAGPPSTTTLVYAFAIPFSLIIATVVASLRIADRLDEKFLEELERNKAIMEENEDDMIDYEDDEDDGEEGVKKNKGEDQTVGVEAAGAPVARNRPKKLVQ